MSVSSSSANSVPWPIRPVTANEFPEFCRTSHETLLSDPLDEEQITARRAMTDLDRTLAAFDGSQIIGTTLLFSFDATLPGGSRRSQGSPRSECCLPTDAEGCLPRCCTDSYTTSTSAVWRRWLSCSPRKGGSTGASATVWLPCWAPSLCAAERG